MTENLEMPQKQPSSQIGLIAFGTVAIAAVAFISYKSMTKPEVSTMSGQANSGSSLETVTVKPVITNFKDGVYDVVGEYVSPGGPESINVKLTLKNNVITEAEVVPNATLENSVKFQGLFIDNYKEMVVGKSISDLKLDKIAGSSLTPKGFNDALEKIKSQAKS